MIENGEQISSFPGRGMEGGCDYVESLGGEFCGDTLVLHLGRGGGGFACGKMA